MNVGRTVSVFCGGVLLAVAGCTSNESVDTTTTTAATPSTSTTVLTPTQPVALPEVLGAEPTTDTPVRYELFEIAVELEAEYGNPFDQREVALDATFTDPEGNQTTIPGFWDAEGSWLLRFTPSSPGSWTYDIVVTDARGTSDPLSGTFDVEPSDHKGFLRVGSDVDPDYSSRYFAYEDATPWYGRGHADLDMSFGGAALDGSGLRKFATMERAGENYEMWWPIWGNNFIQDRHDTYTAGPMRIIDFIVGQAEEHDIALVFTVWTHQFLRTGAHDWPDDRWQFNGFSRLTDIAGFFVEDEAWAWQENYYRYIIARWSYSTAVLMWQTITEINGTESYDQTDPWHERVNAYFQQNDPFRHPTTATGSGNYDWPVGHAAMDVAQVHLYEVFVNDPITDSATVAEWTRRMWNRVEKPNWIGEYGVRGQQYYPEMMHHTNWAALGAGASMTPIEWNDNSAYNSFDEPMIEDMRRFADFVETVQLTAYDPVAVDVTTSDDAVRGWGVVGDRGGVVWIQDAFFEGASLELQRVGRQVEGITVTVAGVPDGQWMVSPYNTWTGEWLETVEVTCVSGSCAIPLPTFNKDIALALGR